jgi:hypothetical protein
MAILLEKLSTMRPANVPIEAIRTGCNESSDVGRHLSTDGDSHHVWKSLAGVEMSVHG